MNLAATEFSPESPGQTIDLSLKFLACSGCFALENRALARAKFFGTLPSLSSSMCGVRIAGECSMSPNQNQGQGQTHKGGQGSQKEDDHRSGRKDEKEDGRKGSGHNR